jgi:hypothetical protein
MDGWVVMKFLTAFNRKRVGMAKITCSLPSAASLMYVVGREVGGKGMLGGGFKFRCISVDFGHGSAS